MANALALLNGSYNDVIFSADGTKIYASSAGSVLVFSTAGTLITTYATGGSKLVGMDITPDGHTLLVADNFSNLVTTNQAAVRLYAIDLDTGTVTARTTTLTGSGGGFYDVTALSNSTAILTRNDPSNSASLPLVSFDIAGGTFSNSATGFRQTAALTNSAGHSGTLIGAVGGGTQSYATLDASGAITHSISNIGYYGVVGVQAYSVAGNKIIEGDPQGFAGSLALFDASFNYIGDIAATLNAQMLRGTVSAIAFNSDGSKLYGFNPTTQIVYEFATTDWHVTNSWMAAINSGNSAFPYGFGNEISVSSDNHYLTVIGGTKTAIIDLTQVGTIQGTSGNDILAGTSNPDAIYGLDGNDTLTGNGSDTLIGGNGDDNYIITGSDNLIIELPGGGNDSATVSTTFTAPDNVETLILAAGASAILYASAAGTRLIGNDLGTSLFGGVGDDVLIGGRGDDSIYGGSDGYDIAIVTDTLVNSFLTVFPYATRFYQPPFELTVRSADGNDGFKGIDQIQFNDGSIYTANAVFINDSYNALLGRSVTAFELAAVSATMKAPLSATEVRAGVIAALHINADQDDFNGDGRSDILWRNADGTISTWLGTATGGFTVNDANARITVSNAWHIADTGDFNGDGRTDILWRSDTGGLSNWLGTASGGFTPNDGNALQQVPTNWHVAHVGDFNGDGRSDILWRNDAGQISDWLGTATGGFVNNDSNAFQNVPLNWHIADVGDFNGDGRSDILWRSDEGRVSDWLGTASGGFTPNDGNALSSAPLSWHIVDTGDFNGDGRTDILWRSDAGGLSDWLGTATGGFINNDSNAFRQVSLDWTIVDTGDYNGDGFADILWRNASGALSNWLGNSVGGFTNNDANAFTHVDSSWSVQVQNYLVV